MKYKQRTTIAMLKRKFEHLKMFEAYRHKNDLMMRWINREAPFKGTDEEARSMGFKLKKDLAVSI